MDLRTYVVLLRTVPAPSPKRFAPALSTTVRSASISEDAGSKISSSSVSQQIVTAAERSDRRESALGPLRRDEGGTPETLPQLARRGAREPDGDDTRPCHAGSIRAEPELLLERHLGLRECAHAERERCCRVGANYLEVSGDTAEVVELLIARKRHGVDRGGAGGLDSGGRARRRRATSLDPHGKCDYGSDGCRRDTAHPNGTDDDPQMQPRTSPRVGRQPPQAQRCAARRTPTAPRHGGHRAERDRWRRAA